MRRQQGHAPPAKVLADQPREKNDRPMNRRIAIIAAAICLSALALFALARNLAYSYQLEQTLARGQTTLRLAVAALNGRLDRYKALPLLIAEESDLELLLANPTDEVLLKLANERLERINKLAGSTDIYLMDPSGRTLAASNYDGPTSFVGQNFSFRPYFKEAMMGMEGHFFALGTTSGKRGYYFSAPVMDGSKVIGAIVLKLDLNQIEASWRGNSEYEIAVVDPDGIIFLASHKDWLYRSFRPLSKDVLADTHSSQRYAGTPLSELPVISFDHRSGYDLIELKIGGGQREYASLTRAVSSAGWSVRVMVDTRPAHTQALTVAFDAVLALGLITLIIAIILRERSRFTERIRLHRDTQMELEKRVLVRTNDLAEANRRLEEEVQERRATEEQLRKTQSDLVQAGKLAALGQMSAALSHEFNQPLAALEVYADNAEAYLDLDRLPEVRENIGSIARLIKRLTRMSRHLRSFARKPDEKLRPVIISEVLNDMLELLARHIEATGARIDVEIAEGAECVLAGTVRLQQVLLNLVSNALDASEDAQDKTIHIAAQITGESRVLITVRDHGSGVPLSVAERIFDPFFTTKGPGKGLGLGLSISYNIVKDFGGTLSVYDHPEGGAVFALELETAAFAEDRAYT